MADAMSRDLRASWYRCSHQRVHVDGEHGLVMGHGMEQGPGWWFATLGRCGQVRSRTKRLCWAAGALRPLSMSTTCALGRDRKPNVPTTRQAPSSVASTTVAPARETSAAGGGGVRHGQARKVTVYGGQRASQSLDRRVAPGPFSEPA